MKTTIRSPRLIKSMLAVLAVLVLGGAGSYGFSSLQESRAEIARLREAVAGYESTIEGLTRQVATMREDGFRYEAEQSRLTEAKNSAEAELAEFKAKAAEAPLAEAQAAKAPSPAPRAKARPADTIGDPRFYHAKLEILRQLQRM